MNQRGQFIQAIIEAAVVCRSLTDDEYRHRKEAVLREYENEKQLTGLFFRMLDKLTGRQEDESGGMASCGGS